MIELTLVDLLVWTVGITILTIGAIRVLSYFLSKIARNKRKNTVMYCNICVSYFDDISEASHVDCPKCGRSCRRGRIRNLG